MRSIDKLAEILPTLNAEESAIFDRIVAALNMLVLSSGDSPEVRRKVLNEVEKYLKKKNERPKKENTGDKAEYLRFVRNSFAHKSSVPAEVVTLAIPMFWAVLKESAPQWNVTELNNLLAYAIRDKHEYPGNGYATTNDVVQHYQSALKKIPPIERHEVFRELLLSLFVTPQFQDALLSSKPVGKNKRGEYFVD
jgi:hypothetical protein